MSTVKIIYFIHNHPIGLNSNIYKIQMEFRGPCEYKKGAFKNLKHFEILDASIQLAGKVIPLPENCFSVEQMGNSLYVAHSYRFFDEDANICGSQWFNSEMPLHTFKNVKSLFRHVIHEYHDGSYNGGAIIRIFFTEKAAEELRNFVSP